MSDWKRVTLNLDENYGYPVAAKFIEETAYDQAIKERDEAVALVDELKEVLEFYSFPLQTAWHDIKEIEAARRENNNIPIWGPARRALEKIACFRKKAGEFGTDESQFKGGKG